MEYEEYLSIPKERVGALIGKNGDVLSEIAKQGHVQLTVDSNSGEARLVRDDKEDPALAMKASDVVKAIANGFAPDKAMKLFKEDAYLEIIDMKDLAGDSIKAIERQKARIIGTNGKTRKIIEEATKTNISVFGKTVSVIGELDNVQLASKVIHMLGTGMPHADMYRLLENWTKERFYSE